jgi:hypothetical protein
LGLPVGSAPNTVDPPLGIVMDGVVGVIVVVGGVIMLGGVGITGEVVLLMKKKWIRLISFALSFDRRAEIGDDCERLPGCCLG